MRNTILLVSLFLYSLPAFSLALINLYQDDLQLQSNTEIELLLGGVLNYNQSYSGYLLNNDISVSAINEKYYIPSEEDGFSVRSKASGESSSLPTETYGRIMAYTEVYSLGDPTIPESILAVNSIYASSTVDWHFNVEGDGAEFNAVAYSEETEAGILSLYDLTTGSLVIELIGFSSQETAVLIDGHSYELHIEGITTNRDDAGVDIAFDFQGATVIKIPEPPTFLLMAALLIPLCRRFIKRPRATHKYYGA